MNSPARRAAALSRVAPVPDPAPDFDPLARVYRWMEWCTFGPWLGWCRSHFLDELGHCGRALVLGDGDGRFTARLLAANSSVAVAAVDASPAMLRLLARRSAAHAARLYTARTDARSWRPVAPASATHFGPPYDLVVSHFFLDCLTTEEVHALAAAVRRSTASHAVWVVSEFALPPGRLGRIVARPLIGFLYWVFGRLTGLRVNRLPNHALAFEQAGFSLHWRHSRLGGLLTSELWRTGEF